MPPARRRPRWNIGDLYAIHLTPRHDAICQLLEDGHVAILDGAVAAGAPAPTVDEIRSSWIYRVLFVSTDLLEESTRLGRLPFVGADVPPYFTRESARRYTIWDPDGSSRAATARECRGLEEKRIWDTLSLSQRLRDAFLRSGYQPRTTTTRTTRRA